MQTSKNQGFFGKELIRLYVSKLGSEADDKYPYDKYARDMCSFRFLVRSCK